MHSEQLIKYCLTKKHSYIDFPIRRTSVCIKVNGKIFAEIYTHGDNFKITLKCEPILAELFRRQQYHDIVVIKGYHCPPTQRHRNTIYINKGVPDKEIFSMIDHSYDEVIKTFQRKCKKKFLQSISN
jgi:predicted DNA-binding protein (MmcQ/YjbR family)